jgi:hypothetical protein
MSFPSGGLGFQIPNVLKIGFPTVHLGGTIEGLVFS